MIDFLIFTNLSILFAVYFLYFLLLRNKRAPRLFIFYLLSFTLFIESHFILSFFSSFQFALSEWFFVGDFSEDVKISMILAVSLYLLGLIWGELTVAFTGKFKWEVKWQSFYSHDISKLAFYLVLLISPFVIKYVVTLIRFISDNGFYSLYENGEKISGGYILDLFFLLLYILLICSQHKKKISLLIFVFALVYLLIGTRLEFIFKLFPVIVYYFLGVENISLVFNRKNLLFAFFTFFIFIFGMQYSVSLRDNIDLGDNVFFTFLKQQGVSINVLGIAIKDENNNLLNNFVIFSPIYDSIKSLCNIFLGNYQSNGNSVEFAMNSLSLSHKLSLIEDREAYLSGYGVGGNSLAELYLLGGTLFCFIGGALTYYIIAFLEKIAIKSRYLLLFSMVAFGKIIYSPRGEYFSFLSIDRTFLLIILLSFSFYIMTLASASTNCKRVK